jgi:hypothetical protein
MPTKKRVMSRAVRVPMQALETHFLWTGSPRTLGDEQSTKMARDAWITHALWK